LRKAVAALLFVLVLGLAPNAQAEGPDQSLAAVVERVSPSVVGLAVIKREPPEEPGGEPRVIASSGSGFAFRPGYILSNAHVLDHALQAYVITQDGKSVPIDPKNIFADPVSDLAVAKVDLDLTPVTWGDMRQVRLGESVFAMGAPFGLRFQGSVTRGIVSGFDRPLGADYTFLQTDAPINPGNSGGPLFNALGQVVGVNARVIRGADGMGFSIPADLAREIADTLVRDGKVERAWLGLRFVEGDEAALGWSDWEGPTVTLVEADGPAAQSGIQVGDTLLRLNRQPIDAIDDLAAFLRTVSPGTPVTAVFGRGDHEVEVALRAGSRPHDALLYLRTDSLWVEMTPAQAHLARRFGREFSFVEASDLTESWTARSGTSRALLISEFLSVARLSWDQARQGSPMSQAQAEAEATRRRGILEVQIDLPAHYTLAPGNMLWAEWEDEGGSLRAVYVQAVDGAPAGFQRVMATFRGALVEKQGGAVVVLHMDQGTERRFVFDLDAIH